MGQGQQRPEPYDGHAAQMRESPWLASEDLEATGGEAILTIKRVWHHHDVEFEQGRRKPDVYALEFAGAKRQLALNATNRRALQQMFGNHTREWVGKRVTLFVQEGIKVGRETKRGIRIKAAPAKDGEA